MPRWALASRRALLWGVLLAAWATACSGPAPAPLVPAGPAIWPAAPGARSPAPPPNGSLDPIYIDADFAETYAVFVLRTLTLTEKSARWAHFYDGRWVTWCGELKYFTHDGLQFRYFGSTETYDVQVTLPEPQKSALRSQLTIGRFYNYTGRLGRFDESFRILTVDQGTVLRPNEFGVPGTLLPSPEPVWRIGAPPRVVTR
jgi:hypothetical protein